MRKIVRAPAFWGALYLALIPVFGLIYWQSPVGSFHSDTLKFEAAVTNDADELRDLMAGEIQRRTETVDFEQGGEQLTSQPREITVSAVQVTDDDRLVLHTRVPVTGPSAERVLGLSVEIDYRGPKLVTALGKDAFVGYPVYRTDHAGQRGDDVFGVPIPVVYPTVDADEEITKAEGRLFLHVDVNSKLQAYLESIRGDPKSASDYFLRSIYFSVVTVTTLGYGDITPLSTTARILVGAESVLGILFIGLFVNTIIAKRRQRSQSPAVDSME